LFENKYSILSKEKVGDYLGDGDRLQIRKHYMTLFDFTDFDLDIALRQFLVSFRLPGEAQKIDRILESFAEEYLNCNKSGPFTNKDEIWAISFATIMLNTDAHNPQVKKKMTRVQFIENCRALLRKSFPQEYLSDLYDKIVEEEIRMHEDGKTYPNAAKKGWITIREKKKEKKRENGNDVGLFCSLKMMF